MYGNNILLITEPELARLEEAMSRVPGQEAWLAALERKLKRAVVIPPDAMPPDVVTMHATVCLIGPRGTTERCRLVYPDEAVVAENNVSVLAPAGTMLLGMRAGGTLLWGMNWGCTVVTIEAVEQPPSYQRYACAAGTADGAAPPPSERQWNQL